MEKWGQATLVHAPFEFALCWGRELVQVLTAGNPLNKDVIGG
jgi:hypothetical protein